MGIALSLAVFFFAVVIHEFAHGFVALQLGDTTAQRAGRLTLNPLAHIDPFGTVLLPIMLVIMNSPVLFGWAKPIPVNFAALKNPKKDMIWVGLAGPLANLACAFAAAILFKFGLKNSEILAATLQYFMVINVVLAIFNLIPIPPLDGSRVLMGLLPRPSAILLASAEPYGFILLFALLYAGLFDKVVWPVANYVLFYLTRL
ncbi:MAG: site-2 protease family protein [Candidatus Omnitrophica bacterium CG_4_10_14_0_2_um_filter_44_9]|nr:MAG: site-2 protease family protein [Candidatus Omnitrophica bacterium CG_4_10_14_0_8_um_filter_44_12]PIZ84521.1 MAG: site-2 protease family protein [Candidatus Omnitrophica bacterium CG_4_10_14_0_2_um_filter_44_9]